MQQLNPYAPYDPNQELQLEQPQLGQSMAVSPLQVAQNVLGGAYAPQPQPEGPVVNVPQVPTSDPMEIAANVYSGKYGSKKGGLAGVAEKAGQLGEMPDKAIDKSVQEYNKGLQIQNQALESTKQIAYAESEAKLEAIRDHQRKIAAETNRRREEQAEIAQNVKATYKEYEQQADDLRTRKVDPNNVWKDPDGKTNWTTKSLAGIAVALGQFGASLTGGQNAALGIINNMIDRDIQAQRDEIENARADLDVTKNRMAFLRQEMGDSQAAEDRAKQELTVAHLGTLEQIDTSLMPAKKAAEVEQTKAALQAQAAQFGMQAQEKLFNNRVTALGEERAAEATRQSLGIENEKLRLAKISALADSMKERKADPFSPEALRARGLAKKEGAVVNDKDLEVGSQVTADLNDMNAQIDDLVDFVFGAINPETGKREGGTGSKVSWKDDAIAAQQMLTGIQLTLKGDAFERLGILAGPDMDLLEKLTGANPTSLRQDKVKKLLSGLQKRVNRKVEKTLDSRGMMLLNRHRSQTEQENEEKTQEAVRELQKYNVLSPFQ